MLTPSLQAKVLMFTRKYVTATMKWPGRLCLAVAIHFLSPVAYGEISCGVASSDLDVPLRASIEQTVRALPAQVSARLTTFYKKCDYMPAWIAGSQLSMQSVFVEDSLRHSESKGLRMTDYLIPERPQSQAMANTESSIRQFSEYDVLLTVAALRLVSDLRCGRVSPKEARADILDTCEAFDVTAALWALAQSSHPEGDLSSLEPSAPGYTRTKAGMERYRNLLSRAPKNYLAFDEISGAELTSPSMTPIRQRLALEGDLAESSGDGNSGTRVEDALGSFQERHGIFRTGKLDRATYAQLSSPIEGELRQLELTLERWRWIERSFPRPPVVVNIPEFRLRAYDEHLNVTLNMKVIVGGAYHKHTPVFQNSISSIVFRPYWNVPPSIQNRELLPLSRKNPTYLSRHGFEFVRGEHGEMRIRQRPGEANALGLIKFSLPNTHNVYLHDTPTPQLFDKVRRDFSHGCIRVQNPSALAAWIMRDETGWDEQRIEGSMHGATTFTVQLGQATPVLIVYATGFVAEDGIAYFLPDIYGEDRQLEQRLHEVTRRRNHEDLMIAHELVR